MGACLGVPDEHMLKIDGVYVSGKRYNYISSVDDRPLLSSEIGEVEPGHQFIER